MIEAAQMVFFEKLLGYGYQLSMLGTYLAPCGCTLQHAARYICPDTRRSLTAKEIEEVRPKMMKLLLNYFENRLPWHDCKYTDSNINGILPPEKRTTAKDWQ